MFNLIFNLKKIVFLILVLSTTPIYSFDVPLVIGHRGASGHRPEHTLESYKLAIEQGADYIEPDLVITKDGVLIARHENEISQTTNVAEKYPDRKQTKTIDGETITGWFAEDFTLKEIKTLKAKERLEFRSQKFNGLYEVPTFEEIINLVKTEQKKLKKTIGIYPETKHPSYFQSIGLNLEEPLVKTLKKHQLNTADAAVFIQSFELENLKKLKKMTNNNLIFLFDDPEKQPYDFVLKKDKRTYLDLLKPENIKELAATVYGVGPYKRYIVMANDKNKKTQTTDFIKQAHTVGLKVHAYTFRSDKKYLLSDYNNDPIAEYLEFYKLGIDGVFSDFPDDAVKARNLFLKEKSNP